MKRLLSIALTLTMILSLAACGKSDNPANSGTSSSGKTEIKKEYISAGAGTSGSTINTVVLGYTNLLNEYCDYVEVSAEASSGGSDNLRYVQDGVFQISTAGNLATYQAVNGLGDFEGETFENVKGWLPCYASYVMIVVPQESSIQTLQDLRGKRVSVGVKGSGAEVIVASMMEGAGIHYDTDFTPYYLSTADSNDSLIEGSVDAVIYATGVPTPALMELMAIDDVRLIPIETEEAEAIAGSQAYFSAGVIPAGTYDGVDYDIPTLQSFTIAFVSAELDDDTVYAMTKCIWEHLDELGELHSSQKLLDPAMIDEAITPVMELHPGAARYYSEQGWIK